MPNRMRDLKSVLFDTYVYMCAPHREIELLVKLITFLLQIYFRGTRRGSDKVPIHGTGNCDQDIVMGKAVREDKALNAVYFEKME